MNKPKKMRYANGGKNPNTPGIQLDYYRRKVQEEDRAKKQAATSARRAAETVTSPTGKQSVSRPDIYTPGVSARQNGPSTAAPRYITTGELYGEKIKKALGMETPAGRAVGYKKGGKVRRKGC